MPKNKVGRRHTHNFARLPRSHLRMTPAAPYPPSFPPLSTERPPHRCPPTVVTQGKGGKNRRRGKNENEETKRQLEFKEPGQEYAQVGSLVAVASATSAAAGPCVRRAKSFITTPRWRIDTMLIVSMASPNYAAPPSRCLAAAAPAAAARWCACWVTGGASATVLTARPVSGTLGGRCVRRFG